MTAFALIDENQTFFAADGTLASGYQLFVYVAGSATKATTYTESDGLTANTNPIVLDSRGQMPYGCYVDTGTYKTVYTSDTDTDPPASAIRTRDNITARNDSAAAATSEWVTGPTPTYIGTTSFSLVGDQTATFPVGTRLRLTDSTGTVHATISAVAYTSLTTVTIADAVIDSALSAVSYGFLSASNTSSPGYISQLVTGGLTTQTVKGGGVNAAAVWADDGGWETLEQIDLTNSGNDNLSELAFSHTLEDGYIYQVYCQGFSSDHATTNAPKIQVYGVTADAWLVGSGDYIQSSIAGAATAEDTESLTAHWPYRYDSYNGTAAANLYSFRTTFIGLMRSTLKPVMFSEALLHGTSLASQSTTAAHITTTDTYNKIRILTNGGSMDTGTAYLYRLREPS